MTVTFLGITRSAPIFFGSGTHNFSFTVPVGVTVGDLVILSLQGDYPGPIGTFSLPGTSGWTFSTQGGNNSFPSSDTPVNQSAYKIWTGGDSSPVPARYVGATNIDPMGYAFAYRGLNAYPVAINGFGAHYYPSGSVTSCPITMPSTANPVGAEPLLLVYMGPFLRGSGPAIPPVGFPGVTIRDVSEMTLTAQYGLVADEIWTSASAFPARTLTVPKFVGGDCNDFLFRLDPTGSQGIKTPGGGFGFGSGAPFSLAP